MDLLVLYGILLVAVVTYMTIWFVFATYLKRIDAVDSAWGLGFVYIMLITFFSQADHSGIQRATAILVGVWGVRLAVHITKRNTKKAEDHRYAVYRQKWGTQFLQKAYTNIYLVQGLLILIISAPVIAVETDMQRQSWDSLAIVGLVVWALGIAIESLADSQLRRFLQVRKGHKVMQSGLWRYSRHPNYFGEITAWLGAGLVAGSIGRWWGLLGSAVIALLIIKVSGIPPLEKHYKNDKTYQAYAKRTSVLIPLPPKQ